MWKEFFDYVQKLVALTRETEQNRADIEDLRREVHDLTLVVQRLAHEIRRVSDRETNEREKLALQVENQLLRFERRLPPISQSRPDR